MSFSPQEGNPVTSLPASSKSSNAEKLLQAQVERVQRGGDRRADRTAELSMLQVQILSLSVLKKNLLFSFTVTSFFKNLPLYTQT